MGDSGELVCSECPQAVVAAATAELCSPVHWRSSAKPSAFEKQLNFKMFWLYWFAVLLGFGLVCFAFSPQIPYDILATGRV